MKRKEKGLQERDITMTRQKEMVTNQLNKEH